LNDSRSSAKRDLVSFYKVNSLLAPLLKVELQDLINLSKALAENPDLVFSFFGI
jgi:hypothetical protein